MEANVELTEVLAAFINNPADCSIRPLGFGNINDTYLIEASAHTFVLQKINGRVFPDPAQVISNFNIISEHLRKTKVLSPSFCNASPLHTLNKTCGYKSTKGNWWRAQTYIEHTTHRQLLSPLQARELGSVLASFHLLLQDVDTRVFFDPLPGFHDLKSYLHEFTGLASRAELPRPNTSVLYCLEIINEYATQAIRLHQAVDCNKLIPRVVHGDPKIENFIFEESGRCTGLLDLDTVAPGLIQHDLGDCLRSCWNVAGEAAAQTLTVDLEICFQLMQGYLEKAENFILPGDNDYLYEGILHICFELGLRFFMDYLRGNIYFKVEDEWANLNRAVSQFQLVEDVKRNENQIRRIVAECRSKAW